MKLCGDDKCSMHISTLDKVSKFLAELLGTGLLVFLGCMGCINWDGHLTHLQIVFNFGLVVMAVIQIFGCVSGAHLNPAVTAAAWVYKMVDAPMAVIYVAAQMLGGFIGFGLLKLVTPHKHIRGEGAEFGLCTTTVNPDITVYQGLAIEFLATSVLILICCGVWDPRNAKFHDSVPLRFGLAISMLACAAGPYTGASMNPARSFGPALWNGDFKDHWIYWVGPLPAGFIIAYIFKAVFWRPAPPEPVKQAEEFPLKERTNA